MTLNLLTGTNCSGSRICITPPGGDNTNVISIFLLLYFLLELGLNRGPENYHLECEWNCRGCAPCKAAVGLDRAGCNNRFSCGFLKLWVHAWFTTHVAFNLLSLCCFFCHSALCYQVGLEGFHSPKAIYTIFKMGEASVRCRGSVLHHNSYSLKSNDINLDITSLP